MRSAVVLASLVGLAAGCDTEPARLCDRVRVVWPFFDIDAADDVDPAPGIQIDLELKTNLVDGTPARLDVVDPEGERTPHPEGGVVEDGVLRFPAVTVPTGRIELALTAFSECGEVPSRRGLYVWDGTGYPACSLTLGVEPAPSEDHPLGTIGSAADVDGATPGIQIPVAVDAGRPDMEVALFVRDVETATDTVYEDVSGPDLAVDFTVSLPPGEVSIRAVCTWPVEDLRPSSHTARFFVE